MENQIKTTWEDPKPGYKWPVAVSYPIEAPAGKAWKAIYLPGDLELPHPFCSLNHMDVFQWCKSEFCEGSDVQNYP